MSGKINYLFAIILLVISAGVSAQNNQTLYFMNLPQNHLLNPALHPSNTLYIGLPAISGINLNINNNFVNFSDVFLKRPLNDSVITFLNHDYNPDKFLAKIRDNNFFEPQTTIQLLGVGFAIGNDGYIFLDVNDRIEGNVVVPGDLFRLALKGNEQFTGSKIDLSSLRGSMRYYREFGIGFSKSITEKLRLGIRGKLLFGIADASIVNHSLGISVGNDYTHTFDANLEVNFSGPVKVYTDSKNNIDSIKVDDNKLKTSSGAKDFFMGKGNMGVGIDVGATYDLNERITLSASFTDLGFIRWKTDVTNLKANNQFVFSGLNVADVINGSKTFDEVGQDMLDSLKNAFVVTNTAKPYTTYLPFGFAVGGSYNVTPRISVGLLSYTRIIEKQLREALTLSANLNIGNLFSTSISYTAENHRYDNLGAGVSFRAGVAQFYLISDRIPVVFNRVKNDKLNILIPDTWNTINLRLGMNLVFGNRQKEKSDRPMVLVE
jgi:hypothetical protein